MHELEFSFTMLLCKFVLTAALPCVYYDHWLHATHTLQYRFVKTFNGPHERPKRADPIQVFIFILISPPHPSRDINKMHAFIDGSDPARK